MRQPAKTCLQKEAKRERVRAKQIDEHWRKRRIHLLGIQKFLIVYLVFCKTQKKRQTGEYLAACMKEAKTL